MDPAVKEFLEQMQATLEDSIMSSRNASIARHEVLVQKLELLASVQASSGTSVVGPVPASSGTAELVTAAVVATDASSSTAKDPEVLQVALDAPPVCIEMVPVTCSMACPTQVITTTDVDPKDGVQELDALSVNTTPVTTEVDQGVVHIVSSDLTAPTLIKCSAKCSSRDTNRPRYVFHPAATPSGLVLRPKPWPPPCPLQVCTLLNYRELSYSDYCQEEIYFNLLQSRSENHAEFSDCQVEVHNSKDIPDVVYDHEKGQYILSDSLLACLEEEFGMDDSSRSDHNLELMGCYLHPMLDIPAHCQFVSKEEFARSEKYANDNLTIEGKRVLITWSLTSIYCGNTTDVQVQSSKETICYKLMCYYPVLKGRHVLDMQLLAWFDIAIFSGYNTLVYESLIPEFQQLNLLYYCQASTLRPVPVIELQRYNSLSTWECSEIARTEFNNNLLSNVGEMIFQASFLVVCYWVGGDTFNSSFHSMIDIAENIALLRLVHPATRPWSELFGNTYLSESGTLLYNKQTDLAPSNSQVSVELDLSACGLEVDVTDEDKLLMGQVSFAPTSEIQMLADSETEFQTEVNSVQLSTWHQRCSACRDHESFQGGRAVIPVIDFVEQGFIDHEYYPASTKTVLTTTSSSAPFFGGASLSHNYYLGCYRESDQSNDRRLQWDPGGFSMMSAWGQAEFQGGRDVRNLSYVYMQMGWPLANTLAGPCGHQIGIATYTTRESTREVSWMGSGKRHDTTG